MLQRIPRIQHILSLSLLHGQPQLLIVLGINISASMPVLLSFPSLQQMPGIINLALAQFWKFQSVIGWPCCFGPVVRQHIMAGVHSRAKRLTLLLESKRKREREWDPHRPF
jgi:hypothetical protein